MRRCLDCGVLTPGSRCEPCRLDRKRTRSQHARALGPCPQNAQCHLCGQVGARPGDPMTWDHLIPIVRGGNSIDARPAHRSCNSRRQDRKLS